MTQDDIIRMAREAGFVDYELEDHTVSGYDVRYERLIALVAADEREACAQTCEQAGIDGYGTLAAAALIRKRSEA